LDLTNLAMPLLFDAFKVVEDAKAMQIKADNLAKTIQIGAE
jgi:hypothetical protein